MVLLADVNVVNVCAWWRLTRGPMSIVTRANSSIGVLIFIFIHDVTLRTEYCGYEVYNVLVRGVAP